MGRIQQSQIAVIPILNQALNQDIGITRINGLKIRPRRHHQIHIKAANNKRRSDHGKSIHPCGTPDP